eukprot:scaffold2478_cov48-Attheya_sp.AAC.1
MLGLAHTFTVEALRQILQGSSSSLLTSRPTREYANDIGMHFLVDSFPLQFPYGIGGPREKRVTKVEYHECLEYYLRVATSNFMWPDFILLVHSLWEKERDMKSANFRCRTKMNDESMASKIALISPEAIEEEAQRRLNAEHCRGYTQTPAKLFFDTLEIACKSMAHTNEAAKNARRKMFSMWYSICAPGIFFTVSPCDETNFCLRLYIGRAEYILPGADFSEQEDCIGDFKMRCEQRTRYPGASAFDFSAILNIVISDILLGWDEDQR